MKPTGWFQIAWSDDIPIGGVKPLRFFGEELVAFRDNGGAVHVLDAHCQHLGAHLGYGGCVVDDGIQCPFHGWVWSPQGRNVHIPYQDRPNAARRVRPWHVVELNESIHVWHDVNGGEPLFKVPSAFTDVAEHVGSQTFHPGAAEHFTDLRVHPQMFAENAVDPHHFRFVHGTGRSPVVIGLEIDEYLWRTQLGFGKRWTSGTGDGTLNTIVILLAGPGISVSAEHTSDGLRLIAINTTPVDDETSEMFATYWIDESASEEVGRYERRLLEAQRALPDDINIWNHQRYLHRPGLATSEADGFSKLRRWAAKFYPDTVSPARV